MSHSRYCTVEAKYRETRSIERPLCVSFVSCVDIGITITESRALRCAAQSIGLLGLASALSSSVDATITRKKSIGSHNQSDADNALFQRLMGVSCSDLYQIIGSPNIIGQQCLQFHLLARHCRVQMATILSITCPFARRPVSRSPEITEYENHRT